MSVEIGDFVNPIEICVDRSLHNVCYSQRSAFSVQRNLLAKGHIYSFETPKYRAGARRFTVADPRAFWSFYSSFTKGRHFYELIQERKPCRLYFDLEFNIAENLGIDCMSIFDDFVIIVQDVLKETLDLTVPRSQFLVLDSTNTKKYSSHVIVHLPGGQLFSSNEEMQPLINLVSGRGVEAQKLLLSKALSKQPNRKRP